MENYLVFIGNAHFISAKSEYPCFFTFWNERLYVFQSISEMLSNPLFCTICKNNAVQITFENPTEKNFNCNCPEANPFALKPLSENELKKAQATLKNFNG